MRVPRSHLASISVGFMVVACAAGGECCGGACGTGMPEVVAFYWTVLAPGIVNSGRVEQDSASV